MLGKPTIYHRHLFMVWLCVLFANQCDDDGDDDDGDDDDGDDDDGDQSDDNS